ncbi:hypothetical protein ElyMa_001002600 [Elysia marginata]|uniref:Uncharacterized protein n=1 Tax=Elysia marginata TaxID=1093978 RepID=A0AAV4HI33_9GAST|nr:hypothetical protein ElyMa_001002600 [Elysia marginata]
MIIIIVIVNIIIIIIIIITRVENEKENGGQTCVYPEGRCIARALANRFPFALCNAKFATVRRERSRALACNLRRNDYDKTLIDPGGLETSAHKTCTSQFALFFRNAHPGRQRDGTGSSAVPQRHFYNRTQQRLCRCRRYRRQKSGGSEKQSQID